MEATLKDQPDLVNDKYNRIASVIQTLINVVFVTSWILISLIITLCVIFIVVLFFIA